MLSSIMSHSSQPLTATVQTSDRLDRFLAQNFPDISRARFQKLIADGQVTVEGQSLTEARYKLKTGQTVSVLLPEPAPAEPQAEAITLSIIYEDDDLIIIDKPAGLVVHPGAGHETGTLVNALLAHCGDSLSGIGGVKRPGIVHRLDKETSGLLVVAKNDLAHHGLSEQFAAHGRDGRLKRCYQAIVWGAPERRHGIIDTGIARSTKNRQKMAVSAHATARQAITHYDLLEELGGLASLLQCQLETGRTHQIRVHLTHLGHPLLGDPLYGQSFKASINKLSLPQAEALRNLNRQALHAISLGFDHPRTGKPLYFESKLPDDMVALLAALRKSG